MLPQCQIKGFEFSDLMICRAVVQNSGQDLQTFDRKAAKLVDATLLGTSLLTSIHPLYVHGFVWWQTLWDAGCEWCVKNEMKKREVKAKKFGANSSQEKVGLNYVLRHTIKMEFWNKMRTMKYLKLNSALENTLYFYIKLFHFQVCWKWVAILEFP